MENNTEMDGSEDNGMIDVDRTTLELELGGGVTWFWLSGLLTLL